MIRIFHLTEDVLSIQHLTARKIAETSIIHRIRVIGNLHSFYKNPVILKLLLECVKRCALYLTVSCKPANTLTDGLKRPLILLKAVRRFGALTLQFRRIQIISSLHHFHPLSFC